MFTALEAILAFIPQKDDEPDEEFERRKQVIKDQLTPHIVDLPEHECFIRLVKKSSHSTLEVNQVSPSGINDIVEAQKQDLDIQRMIRILKQQEPPPNQVNFTSRFFQKLNKNKKRLVVEQDVLYRNFYDQTGKTQYKQIVVPDSIIGDIIRTLHDNPMQGHPGSSKMLNELRKRLYAPNLAQKVQEYVDNCQMCIRTKPISQSKITPPLQKIYDPCNGPEDILEIDLVGELPSSNGYK